jgi:hypothetical protein
VTSLWNQIQNLKSKENDEYERKMKEASDSTIMSLKKLDEMRVREAAHHGNT